PLPPPVVAPYAGAWIETCAVVAAPDGAGSRPTRARGLKQSGRCSGYKRTWSRPTRARGLKHDQLRISIPVAWSRPTRARGLKRRKVVAQRHAFGVAPYAGAWIETIPVCGTAKYRRIKVAPYAGAWIETIPTPCAVATSWSRALRGRVD